ncbi:MAG: acetate/propionate family kinase [Gammaproteobacteria bacterium]|nr:acetate/propionate family kinase [Gammaproteobacteria bacterium]
MNDKLILTVNAGSSSLRCALFDAGAQAPQARWRVRIELPGSAQPARGHVELGAHTDMPDLDAVDDAASALAAVLTWLQQQGHTSAITAAAHRVVHGGGRAGPARVDDALLAELAELSPLAPLHQPNDLATIRVLARQLPGTPQIACFDTAFHHTMPAVAQRVALPGQVADRPLRRYGFHGLSYESIATQMRTLSPETGRVVVAHLGNGASLCALRDGRSLDTTMGLTPLDGIPMGTRSGAIDPGLLLWLLESQGHGVDGLAEILYRQSGLLGLSGISADMRELLASRSAAAREAVAVFTYRCAQAIAAMSVALGGLDALVFTGGIGERAASVRADIVTQCAFLGLALDEAANENHAAIVASPDSTVDIRVMTTDEASVMARHALRVLAS